MGQLTPFSQACVRSDSSVLNDCKLVVNKDWPTVLEVLTNRLTSDAESDVAVQKLKIVDTSTCFHLI